MAKGKSMLPSVLVASSGEHEFIEEKNILAVVAKTSAMVE